MGNEKLNNAYEGLLKSVEQVEEDLYSDGRVDPKRKIVQTLDIMDDASDSIDIVGINAIGPVHQGRESIIKLLNYGGSVGIGVMDYRSNEFNERVKHERDRSKRIISELATTLSTLNDIKDHLDPNLNDSKFQLFLHRYPRAALVISDISDEAGLMQFNVYPTEDGTRGLTGITYLIKPGDGDAFKRGIEFYEMLKSEGNGGRLLTIGNHDYFLDALRRDIDKM